MNIFVLDQDPEIAAKMHCDSHCVKMILEYGQLLSTAHRLLDGTLRTWEIPLANGKIKTLKFWVLPGELVAPARDPDDFGGLVERWKIKVENRSAFAASHLKHPAAIWARLNSSNYKWLFTLFDACLTEYTHRYGRVHSTESIRAFLSKLPVSIDSGEQTAFPQAMPIEYKNENAVLAYQNYYMGEKIKFAKWTNRAAPTWFAARLHKALDLAYFERTRTAL